MSNSVDSFQQNLFVNVSKEIIKQKEEATRGQSENKNWYLHRKGVISASKAHRVIKIMEKVHKLSGGVINMWSLNQNISGLVFVNPDIPALKYGRTMEVEAVNTFLEIARKCHKNFKAKECELFLDRQYLFIGASPDRIISCSCCGEACIEVKRPYKISSEAPTDKNLDYLVNVDEQFKLNK